MISLKYLKMKPVKVSEEVVRNFRQGLEKATKDRYEEIDKRQREAYIKSQTYVLD